jgi:HEAT repeat protein
VTSAAAPEEDRWRQEQDILRRAAAELAHRRAEAAAATITDLARLGPNDSFDLIARSLDDPSAEVRTAAVRTLYHLNSDLAASFFNNALRQGSLERRSNLGAALTSSGLVSDAIDDLLGPHQEKTYSAFSLLFLVAKAGEIEPLMRVIEDHSSLELRLALIKLLALSGESKILPAFYHLSRRGSLTPEIRSAVKEAIYDLIGKKR